MNQNDRTKYAAMHARALGLMRRIETALQDQPAPDAEHLHWGHVGNIGKVNKDLEEILRFLKG
jgi:hypothetical protein